MARVGRTALNYNQGSRSSEDAQLDEKRRLLEYIMQSPCSSDHPSAKNHVSAPPPAHRLTSGTRKRLELEIELLASLADSDEAIPHLMNLWVHECPSAAADIDKLQYLDRLSPAKAETMLRAMVQQYPDWPEPAARLALLIGLNHNKPHQKQRAGEEALYYMDQVMIRKPWHFEVQHMQVLLSLQHHNLPRAIRAARVRLPPRTQPQRRAHWVKTAVAAAKEQLDALERRAQQPRLPVMDEDMDEEEEFEDFPDAWQ